MLSRTLKQLFVQTKLYRNVSSVTDSVIPSIVNNTVSVTESSDLSKNETFVPKTGSEISKKSCVEDISQVYPYLRPGSVLASFVNDSDLLKELLKFGVNFYKLEKQLEAIPFMLSLQFENIKDHIVFLTELGLQKDKIGEIITKNPFIFREELDNLKVRINYLQYKKFQDDMIIRILEHDPMWLSTSCQKIDQRLGFFQQTFALTSTEVRTLTVTYPKLITYDPEKVKLNIFVLKEEMGFSNDEVKSIIMKKPKLLINGRDKIIQTFDYLHNYMKIPLERIVQCPEILTCRKTRLQHRHTFLAKLGKAQYNPKQPNYVALTTLVSGTDADFSTQVAKSSVQTYNAFLKSL